MKGFQATGEAFSPPKRTSSFSIHEISSLFPFLLVIFVLLDPDPQTQLNPDPDPKHWFYPNSGIVVNICIDIVVIFLFLSGELSSTSL